MATPEMEVRLVEQLNGSFKIVVYLRSVKSPTVRTLGELNPAVASNAKDLIHKVGVLAGAIAERQGTTYGDNHDPDECYRIAGELFKEAALEYGQRKPELREKVRQIVIDPENHIGKTAHVSAKSH